MNANEYLSIPSDFWESAPAPRWSASHDAVESRGGVTLAVTPELALILEGVFATPPVPHFAFVLAMMMALRHGPQYHNDPKELKRLQEIYAATVRRRSARNTGVLIAELCREIPALATSPNWDDVKAALIQRTLHGVPSTTGNGEVPPLTRFKFLQRLALQLRTIDDTTLEGCLTQGGPPTSGEDLAEATLTFPQRVASLLAILQTRERLIGAWTLTSVLDAALSFPSRRPRPDRLPQGGYADVTTHGEPERLLPSQFALDPDEFVRRFAERELLYFRREEPHKTSAPERRLILDQGIRAWGVVRHGLTAGVVSLLKKDPKRHGVSRLSLTSREETVDLDTTPPETIADYLEAGDLTANPARVLAKLITDNDAEEGDSLRDLLLFTHPRSLNEQAVRQAANRLRPSDRLFGISLDDQGRAELCEWAQGGWTVHHRFRVDLASAEAARIATPRRPAPSVSGTSGWSGDVEPIPFPFRAGTVSELTGRIGFDAEETRVVVIGKGGIVYSKRLSSREAVEILPRAYLDGEILADVSSVLSVNGGVVLFGRLKKLHQEKAIYVAAHYSFEKRTVQVHRMELEHSGSTSVRSRSLPELNCVVIQHGFSIQSTTLTMISNYLLDLRTGEIHHSIPASKEQTSFEVAVWKRLDEQLPSPMPCITVSSDFKNNSPPYKVSYDFDDDSFIFSLKMAAVRYFVNTIDPTIEGESILKNASRIRAEYAGDVLAIQVRGEKAIIRLYLVQVSNSAIRKEFSPPAAASAFRLSASGSLLARQCNRRELEVVGTAPGSGSVATLKPSGFHTRLEVGLTESELIIRIGKQQHCFTLDRGTLVYEREVIARRPQDSQQHAGYGTSDIVYDRSRFLNPITAGPWIAAFDTWGQVVLLDRDGRFLLAIAVRLDRAAAWLPDGTGWGSPELLGGPAHLHAAERIGQALQAVIARH